MQEKALKRSQMIMTRIWSVKTKMEEKGKSMKNTMDKYDKNAYKENCFMDDAEVYATPDCFGWFAGIALIGALFAAYILRHCL